MGSTLPGIKSGLSEFLKIDPQKNITMFTAENILKL